MARSFTDPSLPEDAPGTPVVVQSPFSGLPAPSNPGTLPLLAPALVSGPAPTARAHGCRAVSSCRPDRVWPQSVTSDLRLFAVPRWLILAQQVPRRGFQSSKGLMRHITHHHTGSVVDEDTCAPFVAIERVTCSTPSCGGFRRSGAKVCNRRGQATPARPPAVGDIIMDPVTWLAPRIAPMTLRRSPSKATSRSLCSMSPLMRMWLQELRHVQRIAW